MYTKRNDEAVSPVIGVILMVAITMILAAVVAAFSFGMVGNMQKTHVVMLTMQKINSDTISMTDHGGQDQASFANVTITAPQGFTMTDFDGTDIAADADGENYVATSVATPAIGSSLKLTSTDAWDASTRILAVGNFIDGGTQILIDEII
jgi:flagellin-like protein